MLKEKNKLPTATHSYPLIFFIFCLVLVVFTLLFIGSGQAAEFSHEDCQYPTRTTNPPNGCDNTDPCDPNNTENASGACVEEKEPESHNTELSKVTAVEGKQCE